MRCFGARRRLAALGGPLLLLAAPLTAAAQGATVRVQDAGQLHALCVGGGRAACLAQISAYRTELERASDALTSILGPLAPTPYRKVFGCLPRSVPTESVAADFVAGVDADPDLRNRNQTYVFSRLFPQKYPCTP